MWHEILQILEERFCKTRLEKIDEVIKKLKTEFKVDEKDDEQSWWDKFESIVTDANEIDLENN